ncbi:MAG: NADH-quinone oxidoreductase subunit L, partial [Nitrososphaerota archaeon]|nr:NADH-quinone oxidoreductase subunit L [Nitrososphaerota archaeon]
ASSLLAALFATSLFFLSQFTQYTLTGKIDDIQTLAGYNVTWVPGVNLKAGVLVDPLTAVLANAVAWISFLIIVYSLGYMKNEKNLTRYYFLMNFFIGNMLLLVMADNFLQLFLGWEGVGFCSYALIGFWHSDEKEHWVGRDGEKTLGVEEDYSPTHAGMKAFLMTRAGDIAFLVGILIIFAYAHTFNFMQLFSSLSSSGNWATNLQAVGLFIPSAILIFGGAIGKSAQFPLHEWLPDAMAGPTSVSALIHAATMVNAGVFLIGTVGPLYVVAASGLSLTFPFFLTVAVIGGFTAFLAASQAMVLDELKKVLAYSTVSQIGYMMLGLGVAGLSSPSAFAYGYTGAFFHLISQALFKAGLFMCAGWLIHATESKFMKDMGGLRKNLKITFVSMLIVALSLAGIFPLSGFWSKDAILSAATKAGDIGLALYVLGVVTALMTAFYSIRMIGLIFYGEKSPNLQKLENEHDLHEAPATMWVPYAILAGVTLLIGLLAPFYVQPELGKLFSSYLGNFGLGTTYATDYAGDLVPLSISLALAIVGALVAYLAYIRRSVNPANIIASNGLFGATYSFFQHRWYMNSIYYKIFVFPIRSGSARLYNSFEKKVIEPINIGATDVGRSVSDAFQRLETGVEEEYVLAFGIGLVLLIVLLVIFGQI